CKGLSRLVRDRDLTVLLAVLYARQVLARQTKTLEEELSNNIPDLMLRYLSEVNRGVPDPERLADATVHRDAKLLAWACLQARVRPAAVKREHAATALRGDDPERRLDYLERRLRVLQPVFPDKLRFALDPPAEYLADLYIIEEFGNADAKWQAFVRSVDDQAGAGGGIRGFLSALWDCCRAKGEGDQVPPWVTDAIPNRPGVS